MEAIYVGCISLDPRCDKKHQVHWYLWAAENAAYFDKYPVLLEIEDDFITAKRSTDEVSTVKEMNEVTWSLRHSIAMVTTPQRNQRPEGDLFAYYTATGPVDVCATEFHVFQLLDASKTKIMYQKLDRNIQNLRSDKGLSVDDAFLSTGKSVDYLHTLWRSGNHIFEAMHICGYQLSSNQPSDLVNFDVQVGNFYFRSFNANQRGIRSTPNPQGLLELLEDSPRSPKAEAQTSKSNETSQVILVDISQRSIAIVDPRRKLVLLDTLFRNVVRLFQGTAYPDHFGMILSSENSTNPTTPPMASSNSSTSILHIFRCSTNQLCEDVFHLLTQSLVQHDLCSRLCATCPIKWWNDLCLQLNAKIQAYGSVYVKGFLNEMYVILVSFTNEKMNKTLMEALVDGTTQAVNKHNFSTDAELCATLLQNIYNLILKMQLEHGEHQRSGTGFGMMDNVLSWAKRSFSGSTAQRTTSPQEVTRRRSSTIDESELPQFQSQRIGLRNSPLLPLPGSQRPSRSLSVVNNLLPTSPSTNSVRRKFSIQISSTPEIDALDAPNFSQSIVEGSSGSKRIVKWTIKNDPSDNDLEMWSVESKESESANSEESIACLLKQSIPPATLPLRARIFQSVAAPSSPLELSTETANENHSNKTRRRRRPTREQIIGRWKDIVQEVISQQRASKSYKRQQEKPASITLSSVSGQIILFQELDNLSFLTRDQYNRSVTNWNDILNNLATPRSSTTSTPPIFTSPNENNRTSSQACQEGVPATMRHMIWPHLMKVSAVRQHLVKYSTSSQKNEDQDLLNLVMDGVESNYERLLHALTPHQHAILIDVGRTFPHQKYFKFDGSIQMSLFNLLKAYSLADPEVGYCQGLSFVAGILLLHMNEEAAFQCFLQMMFVLNLRELFLPTMQHVQRCFYQLSRLLNTRCPKLFEMLESLDISCTLYASSWFLSLFATQFPLPFVIRIFDLIMLFGEEAIFRVGYLLMKYSEPFLLERSGSFDDVCNFLRVGLTNFPVEVQREIIKEAFQMSLADELQIFRLEYSVMNEAETLFMETQRLTLQRELSRFTRENSAKIKSLEAALEFTQEELQRTQRTNDQASEKIRALIKRLENPADSNSIALEQIKIDLEKITNVL